MALDEARGEPTTHQILATAINSGKYGYVTRRGSFALWKRGHKKDNNEQGAKLIGLIYTQAETRAVRAERWRQAG